MVFHLLRQGALVRCAGLVTFMKLPARSRARGLATRFMKNHASDADGASPPPRSISVIPRNFPNVYFRGLSFASSGLIVSDPARATDRSTGAKNKYT